MRILIAPDSFKDSLRSSQVAEYLKIGIERIFSHAKFELIPLADGGEGTVDAIISASFGKIIRVKVHDPLMREIDSFFGIMGDGETAVIEMAAASGLERLKMEERNPWFTSTYGTGELIKAALDYNCNTIIIGIGGSATNDAGVGMANALGVKFLDEENQPVACGGGYLDKIVKIDLSGIDPRLSKVKIIVACDVTNPLTGPKGASVVYGPQKGADEEMVKKLDYNLSSFARKIQEQIGTSIDNIPGAGAAGGLGAGLKVFLKAEMEAGFNLISRLTNFENKIAGSDLVITAEGKVDYQTNYGKTAQGIARLAQKYNKPVILVTGTIAERAEALYENGIGAIVSIIDKPMNLDDALLNAPKLTIAAGERIARLLKIGMLLND